MIGFIFGLAIGVVLGIIIESIDCGDDNGEWKRDNGEGKGGAR